MDRERGLPRMAPFTPPCLRGVLPPQHVPRSDIRMQLDGPRARSATHGSLHSALPTWGSPSAASASFWHIRMELGGPRARSATHGSRHSALPTWGFPSAASRPSSVDMVATHARWRLCTKSACWSSATRWQLKSGMVAVCRSFMWTLIWGGLTTRGVRHGVAMCWSFMWTLISGGLTTRGSQAWVEALCGHYYSGAD